ncbi:glycosyltransferase [Prochlorococcus sp. MIT 1300]|uniref:glycosyltransferase n=1 Tax=Prochlorococcus sp. MIT 1300 TaxID=3096218 RepID=UPI002A75AB94|nr:glycosyltransferase [Prochlorococcus sp. MIT 1300]
MITLDREKKKKQIRLSVVLPTYNEYENIQPLIDQLLIYKQYYDLEILVVDDDSRDGTSDLVKSISSHEPCVRLISRVGRYGLASAIKEGLLDATGSIAVVMDSDGQHETVALLKAVKKLINGKLDLVSGSRFLGEAKILGLSRRRTEGSSMANRLARFSLPLSYGHLTDYMSGFIVLNLSKCLPFVRKVDVNGFKFLYELLSISGGCLLVDEFSFSFQPREFGRSKLDLAILWDFWISLVHTITFRLIPRRAISFAFVGFSGVFVQLFSTKLLMKLFDADFVNVLPISVVLAATSNYLINNALTFRFHRLRGWLLFGGLLKFLLVASLPVVANVGLATIFYQVIAPNELWAQMAGIFVVFVWNYAASSRFVWNTP